KYYEGAKEQLKSEEKRKVQFVAMTLSEPEKKLTGKERIDALQKLSDKANDVAQALAEKNADFAVVAGKFQLPVKTTGDFTQAAQKLNLKLEKLPPFSLADELERKASSAPETIPDLPMIKNAVADLHANEVADPIPTSDGAVVAVVEKRDPPDPAQAGTNRA